jgi:hypothetical protein
VNYRLAACAAAFAIAMAGPVSAGPPSATLTVTSTTLDFSAVNMTATALAATPLTVSASITFTTTAGGAGGTVTVTPVNLAGTGGATLDARDFTMTCTRVSGNAGFVAAAAAKLSGPTTCGTLTQGKNGVTSTFSIELTLDDTTTATAPFEAAAVYAGTFTVTATAS